MQFAIWYFDAVLAVLVFFVLIPLMRMMRQAKKQNEEALANTVQIRKAVEEIRHILRGKKN